MSENHATHLLGICQLLNGQLEKGYELSQEEREHLWMVIFYCERFLDGEEIVPGDPYIEMHENEYRMQDLPPSSPGKPQVPLEHVDVYEVPPKSSRSGDG